MARLAAAAPAVALAFIPLAAVPADPPTAATPQKAFVARYCASCHNSRTVAGGLDLAKANYVDLGRTPRPGKRWSASCAPA
jgi:hypothetical protein